jgi:uncharacterized protein GlcG (DUF336 family)
MHNKPVLGAEDAKQILAAAEAFARANQWSVSIAVVDDGGHMLGMIRLDGASAMTARMAEAKARSAALGRRDTKIFEDILLGGRISFLTAPGLEGLLEGGLPVLVDGFVAGAVGVSGAKSTEDAEVARQGIAAIVG